MTVKEDIIKLLNHALDLEHGAYIQYLSHAEIPDGPTCEPIIERLKEIASDEMKHAETFRNLIGGILFGVPSMGVAKTYKAKTVKEILEVNLKGEKEAVDTYAAILKKLNANRDELPYEYMKLEHDVRHILMEEQEHISELKVLLAKT